jgi:hypothetical protein
MSKRSLIVFLAFLVAACAGSPTPVSTPSTAQIDTEEQAVYAALLRNLYTASNYALMDTTATGMSGVTDTGTSLDRMLLDMHDLERSTAESFSTRNATTTPVSPDMVLGVEYVLVSQEEMSQIFSQNRDGWVLFYERYPDTPGITTISRVGFNESLDQALVYIGTMSHWLAGAGYYVLLGKVNGAWIVEQQVMTWIS